MQCTTSICIPPKAGLNLAEGNLPWVSAVEGWSFAVGSFDAYRHPEKHHGDCPDRGHCAAGQGIIAVECGADHWQTRGYLSRSCDAEREVLWVLNGHYNSPIAGYSTIDGTSMSLTASVLDEAGGGFIEVTRSGPADRPRELGRAVGLALLDKGAASIIARTRPVHEGTA